MAKRSGGDSQGRVRETFRFRKTIRAPLSSVYRWCTDFREDDDRLTDDAYQYEARIVLREPRRVVRIIRTPGKDRNRNTDVEVITLNPPNRWRLEKLSVTDDEMGSYRLRRLGPRLTMLEIALHRTWKVRRIPSRVRYLALFNQVWDRYVSIIEGAPRS